MLEHQRTYNSCASCAQENEMNMVAQPHECDKHKVRRLECLVASKDLEYDKLLSRYLELEKRHFQLLHLKFGEAYFLNPDKTSKEKED